MTTSPWPPPTSAPITRTGWYLASDGQWYATSVAPAPDYELGADGEWRPALADDERWRMSRWGFGDFWWGVLGFLVVGVAASLGIAAILMTQQPGAAIDEVEFGPFSNGALVAINALVFIGVPWLATRRKGLRSLAADFGLRGRPIDLLIGLGLGIAALIGAGIASSALDALLSPAEETTNVPVDSLDGAGEFIVFLFAVGVLTPIIEELFFRGLVYRSFLKRGTGTVMASIWTTVIFVIPHLLAAETWKNLIILAAAIAVLGAMFQLACHLTGNRLLAPIIAHMVINCTATIALFVT